MRPTPRSVHARQLIKIFDGECREDNFRRARMIRAFTKNAMMDMGIVKIKIDILMAFPRPGLQQYSRYIMLQLPYSVKFAMSLVSVFLQFADPTVETKVELVYRSQLLSFYSVTIIIGSASKYEKVVFQHRKSSQMESL